MYFYAGAPYHPGTNLPSNVTGECPHRHRTAAKAQDCIRKLDRSIKRGHGLNAYCDRIVMVHDSEGRRPYVEAVR